MDLIIIHNTVKNTENVFRKLLKLLPDELTTLICYNERMDIRHYKTKKDDLTLEYPASLDKSQTQHKNLFRDSCPYLMHLYKYNIATKSPGGIIFMIVGDDSDESTRVSPKLTRLQYQYLKSQKFKLVMLCCTNEMFEMGKYIGCDMIVNYNDEEAMKKFEEELKIEK